MIDEDGQDSDTIYTHSINDSTSRNSFDNNSECNSRMASTNKNMDDRSTVLLSPLSAKSRKSPPLCRPPEIIIVSPSTPSINTINATSEGKPVDINVDIEVGQT